MAKVVVLVSGGVVQDIYSDDKNTVVTILDEDDMKEEGLDVDNIEQAIAVATQGMDVIY